MVSSVYTIMDRLINNAGFNIAMANPILEKDVDIRFPNFTVLKASAGSGKTYTLTERFVQFVLSNKIPQNNLKNILAITFSNNASKEMKERILLWLKLFYFRDPETLAEFSQIVTLDNESMIKRSGQIIDEILFHYTDFQIRTIDSFMTTIFKASAIDLGFSPEFEILMDSSSLMEYAFNLFLRDVKDGSNLTELLGEIIEIIIGYKKEDSSYLWDPSADLLDEIKKIYRKLASTGEKPKIENYTAQTSEVQKGIKDSLEGLEGLIIKSRLERSGGSSYPNILSSVRGGRFVDLIGRGLKANPVKKPKKTDRGAHFYDSICREWEEVGQLINDCIVCYAHSFYMPYLRLYEAFSGSIERVKKQQGKVFIEDINKKLGEYLQAAIVPDVYFRMGEVIFHYLIDEFQDTSPIQWRNLLPLIENSVSQGGSLFVVGDTKQAIYGFRDADYTIMKSTESVNPFPSTNQEILELETNYRSLPRILEFNEKVFKEIGATNDRYRKPVERSGLGNYTQKPKEGERDSGYVEVELFDKNDEDPPEKRKIQQLVEELTGRGYRYGDIALLTAKNENVVKATTWLNEKNIPFISYSSLDIRRRKITGEIISLLSFLDSPPDDLSFATFILGDIFGKTIEKSGGRIKRERLHELLFNNRNNPPLYKAFQKEFGSLWERYFSELFRSIGYLPLYDLVTEIFKVFRVFELMEDEEGNLVKILEAVKDFEGTGYNSLRNFLGFATDGEGTGQEWNIDVPKNVDSVRVMTVHKAKGLGFPIVIALLYGERSRGFDYIVHQQDGEARLLKINKGIMSCDPLFERLYNEETLNEMVNRLNSLYVEFTRAKDELYVIGVKREKDKFPFDLLPVKDYPPSSKPHKRTVITSETEEAFFLFHYEELVHLPLGKGKKLNIEERRRGDFIHKVLSYLDYIDEGIEEALDQVFKQVDKEMNGEYGKREVRESLMGILGNREMMEYFIEKQGRKIRKEQEFSDGEGRLFRMDRVVIDPDRIAVIDYKTGEDKSVEGDHRAQMKNYMKILQEVYPDRTIEGIIAYVDLKEIRRIS